MALGFSEHGRRRLWVALAGVVVAAAMSDVAAFGQVAASGPVTSGLRPSISATTDWPAYLNGPRHRSYAPAQTAIRPATVPSLIRKWRYLQPSGFFASPTVADGAVFIGSNTGWFYKFRETTGAVMGRRFLGLQPALECPATGFVSTATISVNPKNHRDTVYVAGPDGYLYALNASDLAVQWKSVIAIPSATVNDYYNWSSPTVANGKVYIGVSSNCDSPLVRGGVIAFDQGSGKQVAEFFTVPAGSGNAGGSVWSSVAVAADGNVFASTGNGPDNAQRLAYSESIVKLSPTLRVLGSFKVPASQVIGDGDFGASPIIFGKYVGACNKNGIFYLLNRATMKVRWEKRVGAPADTAECIASPAYNGNFLYLAANTVTIKGVRYPGSVQERRPDSGALVWQTGLPNGVLGSLALDGGGVLAVGTYDFSSPNATYLIAARSGRILRTVGHGMDFAQNVFAGNWLFTANDNGLYAFAVRK
jgi:outer membrane protein assembly factor BamB